jgi:hypothetical protein
MHPDSTDIAMKRTPQQTYLAERLNSAAGLGWQMNQTESTWHGLFRFICPWLGAHRQSVPAAPPARYPLIPL